MKQEFLKSPQGYDIPCHNNWTGQDQVLIICHGFGSSKLSPMVQALHQEMPRHGIGTFAFDFPSHGDSPVWQEGLRVPYCIEDLAEVEAHVKTMAPQAKISYFGSSFGAYITLLYLSRGGAAGKNAFLRSAAVTMPRLVDTWVDDRARADMERQGYFVPEYDYVREMRVTPAFLQDLMEHDVFDRYKAGTARLAMVHGGRDDVAPTADAKRFAETFGAQFTLLPNGEHNLMGEGELEEVLKTAADFFTKERKPVCITADSTCDLPPALLERFQVKIIPLHVTVGEESYLDGVDFTPDMIFARYERDKTLPKTAAVSPQEFQDFFAPLVEGGCEVVHLDISGELSATYQNAVIAAGELSGVYPVDSRHLSNGMALLVLEACRLRDQGKSAAEIAQEISALTEKVNTSFVVDTLEYLWKGGRCSGVAAFGANLLNLKPCIEMREGRLEVAKKYRGSIGKVYEKYIEERLTGREVREDYLFIVNAGGLSQETREKLEGLVRRLAPVREVFFTTAGSAISSHCGPGTLGLMFLEK